MTEVTAQEYAIRQRSTGRRIEVDTLDEALEECAKRGAGWYLDAPPTRGDGRERKFNVTLPSQTRGLVKARSRAGLSREDVAAILGVSASRVKQWEHRDVPAYRRAELLALYGKVRVENAARAKKA